MVYAGCVYWPFQGYKKVGIVLAAVILVAGVISAVWSSLRSGGG